MSKIAVVYWSGTGNTEAMANAVIDGANAAGAAAELIVCGDFNADRMDEFDAVAFGCPSFPAKGSRFSAPTAGATANGCAPGRKAAMRSAHSLPASPLSAPANPMRTP